MIAGEMMYENFVSVMVDDLVRILDLVVFSTTTTEKRKTIIFYSS